jgi:hypothetical protein
VPVTTLSQATTASSPRPADTLAPVLGSPGSLQRWIPNCDLVRLASLIDETRRRLTRRFRDQYKIVTHPSQAPGERTIYVLTQERLLDIPTDRFPQVDFFAIDEFYKLDYNEDRAGLLNQAFHRLHATGAQFYLLGPNIDDLASDIRGKLEF